MVLSADVADIERQARLRALQGLALALLVTTPDHCVDRRIEIQADHIPKLFFKPLAGGKVECARAMWPNVMRREGR